MITNRAKRTVYLTVSHGKGTINGVIAKRGETTVNANLRVVLFSLGMLFHFSPASAASDSQGMPGPMMGAGEPQQIQALKKEISALKAEVQVLRKSVASLQALKPTFSTIMPDIAERFHVMHRAGDAGDWAVAAHEVLELQRLVSIAKQIDAEKGALMEGFMSGNLRTLNKAIGHGKRESFYKAMNDTVKNCNACHVAVGSPFIKVTLDVDESLNMRHPHALGKSKVSGKHTHMH